MDYRKIYNLLGRVIDEAKLGQQECVKDIPVESKLCYHAWENLENLIEEIREVITAEDRAIVKRRAVEALSKNIDAANGSVYHLP